MTTPSQQIWSSLERNSALRAIPSVWREFMGGHFETFQAAFFQKLPEPAHDFFCERCYCTHEVIHQTPEILAALVAAITPAGFRPSQGGSIHESNNPFPFHPAFPS